MTDYKTKSVELTEDEWETVIEALLEEADQLRGPEDWDIPDGVQETVNRIERIANTIQFKEEESW